MSVAILVRLHTIMIHMHASAKKGEAGLQDSLLIVGLGGSRRFGVVEPPRTCPVCLLPTPPARATFNS